MGRSVSVPREALRAFYVDLTLDEDELDEMVGDHIVANGLTDLCRHDLESLRQDLAGGQYEDLVEDLQNVLSRFNSIRTADFWVGREDKAIAQNGLVVIGVSEYCGLASVWVVPETDTAIGLAENWVDIIWPTVEAAFPNRLDLMGRFSNGEAVYRRVNAMEGDLA